MPGARDPARDLMKFEGKPFQQSAAERGQERGNIAEGFGQPAESVIRGSFGHHARCIRAIYSSRSGLPHQRRRRQQYHDSGG